MEWPSDQGDSMMKKLFTGLNEQARRCTGVFNWLIFLGGISIAGISVAVEMPGGWFVDKVMTLALRFATMIVLFGILAFRANISSYVFRQVSWWELPLASAFGIYQGVLLFRSVSGAYLTRFESGEAPGIAQHLFDAIPLSVQIKEITTSALTAVLAILGAIAFLFLTACVIRLLVITLKTAFAEPDYPDAVVSWSCKRRVLFGAVLSVVTMVLCFLTLNKGQDWGADYTVYLAQAISFATGHVENINIVWGYGAMLIPVYLLVGFDRVDFSSIIYYKIPDVICLGLLVFVLFLFFSKRFKPMYAAALTAMFGLAPLFVSYTNIILTNIPHMLFTMLALICLYKMFQTRSLAKQIIFAVLGGILIGISDLIRVNGIVMILTLACAHIVCIASWLLRNKRFFGGLLERMPLRHIAVHAIPYIVYFVFIQVVNHIVFSGGAGIGAEWGGLTAGAETMASMLSGNGLHHITLAWFFDSVRYNFSLLADYLTGLSPFGMLYGQVLYLFVPLVLVGIIRSFRKELLSVIFFFGTLMMLCVIVYRQGIRYLFPILPMLVLFFAVGVQSFFTAAGVSFQKPELAKKVLRTGAALLCVTFAIGAGYNAVTNMQNGREFDLYSYSEDAKDIYRYIRNETDPNSTIVFVKPPVIKLNTERSAINSIPAEISNNTYLLITSEGPREHQMTDAEEYGSIRAIELATGDTLQLVYENPRFDLYLFNTQQ